MDAAAGAMKLQTHVLNASTDLEIDTAFATIVRERPDVPFVGPDPFSSAGVSNWSNSRLGTRSLRLMRHVNSSKLAG